MGSGWPTRDLLAHRAGATPDRTALVDAGTGRRWTCRDLDAAVDDLAARLAALGVGEGARVGTLLPTRPVTVRLVHAVGRRDAALVPLHARRAAAQLHDPLARAGVDLLVCGDGTADTAADLADAVDRVVSVDAESANRSESEIGDADERVGAREAVEPLPAPAPDGPGTATWCDDDLAVVLFTSGTTGEPKGVRLTRGTLQASAEASAYRLGVAPGDRWLCCLPTYHMGGLAPVFRTALYGTTLVVQRAFDAGATADVIDERAITGVSLIPTMLARLLDAGWHPPDALETVLLGGAPASESLVERCRRRGVPVYPTYGTTETASQIATARPEQAFSHPGTVGHPLVNTDVRIVDSEAGRPDEPLDPGETGEIVVRGPTVAAGYLENDRTAGAFADGWLHTGDLGYRDAEGRLWVLGRLDDRILSGGENVDPAVVVAAIRDHPDVSKAAVVAIPDTEWGQRVAALVVGGVTPETVREHCRDRLADFEVPKTVAVADALPRTASGTVDRDAVRERL